MKLSIVLYLGSVLLVLTAAAPQKRNPIDFLLDYNQDILVNDTEVPASVKPLTLAQVSAGREGSWRNRQEESNREELADVQETPEHTKTDQSDEERENSDEHDSSDDKDEISSDSQHNQEQENDQSDAHEQQSKEDTTIRVYDDNDDDSNDDDHNDNAHNDDEDHKFEEEQKGKNVANNSLDQRNQNQKQEDTSHDDRTDEDNSKYLQTQPISSEESVPSTIDFNHQHAVVHDSRRIEVQPDQLFNHGSLIFDKNSFVTQKPELPATAPYNVNRWKGYHDAGKFLHNPLTQ